MVSGFRIDLFVLRILRCEGDEDTGKYVLDDAAADDDCVFWVQEDSTVDHHHAHSSVPG